MKKVLVLQKLSKSRSILMKKSFVLEQNGGTCMNKYWYFCRLQ